jgi:hypothetical protein
VAEVVVATSEERAEVTEVVALDVLDLVVLGAWAKTVADVLDGLA